MSSNRIAVAAVSLVALAACSDAFIEPKPAQDVNVDNRLTLEGKVCTDPPDPSGFPVKVVLVVDQSGSMCVSDPPGSQGQMGFCEMADALLATYGALPTEPARVRAIRALMQQFQNQPNVEVALVPFETNAVQLYPPAGMGAFARPNGLLNTIVGTLQSTLGKGTDYQGAFALTYAIIADDINKTQMNSPELLPRTRYVVVFLTDGTPYPRCSANDSLPQQDYADPDHPDLTWADSNSAVDFCNLLDPTAPNGMPSVINGYVPGTDRNQNYQIFSYVDQIMELRNQFNIGDLRIHSILLFNEQAVQQCGPICQDLYGVYPNVPFASGYPAAAKKIAEWTLKQIAMRGNGVYQAFENGDIANMGLGALDYSSLSAPNVLKQLLVHSMSSFPGDKHRVVDSDGDGLPDTIDNSFTMVNGLPQGTNPFFADTDGDCFSDGFEAMHRDDGFRPDVKDLRGCDPVSMLTPGCTCADVDGDGLSQFAESYLKTEPTLPDSDGDGVPDGIEVEFGLNPNDPQVAGLDTDGDGLPDGVELRGDGNPIKRDIEFFNSEAYSYLTVAEKQPDESVCYTFKVSNIQMVTPPAQSGLRQGYNLFKLWFAQAPESGVATDFGVWRTACAWAEYDPPSVRVPAGPSVTIADSDFFNPNVFQKADDYLVDPGGTGACAGVHP